MLIVKFIERRLFYINMLLFGQHLAFGKDNTHCLDERAALYMKSGCSSSTLVKNRFTVEDGREKMAPCSLKTPSPFSEGNKPQSQVRADPE